jgi:hypothetical protein
MIRPICRGLVATQRVSMPQNSIVLKSPGDSQGQQAGTEGRQSPATIGAVRISLSSPVRARQNPGDTSSLENPRAIGAIPELN